MEQRGLFPEVAPDLVVEVRSPTDRQVVAKPVPAAVRQLQS